ncbi:MAG: PAS domain S-box protein [Nitrospinae bacterium]|nr:PAS domain S-box protein [Nitrospinota bacterium]
MQQPYAHPIESKDYLEALIERSMDAIISTDADGNVVTFNQGAEVLSGYRREEVIGQRVPVLYESEEVAREVMTRMREEGGILSSFETTFKAKDGRLIPVLISASMLYDEEGNEVGTVGFSKDIRERKLAEDELRKTSEELKHSYERLEQAQASAISAEKLAAIGRLTAGVSHEVLNPLAIITMSLQLMIKDQETPPEIADQLRVLEEQAYRIAKITQDLLYFARHRPPERRPLDFNETLQRVLGLLERDLQLHNISVELALSEGLPPVSADQGQLQQVVLNLLTNAKDAMPDGGRLVLSTKTVENNGKKFVELWVEDSGSGIAADHMDKIFDPFFTTKPEGEGTGLGLSICQGIVEAHGGSIRAENIPEGGAAFVIQMGSE